MFVNPKLQHIQSLYSLVRRVEDLEFKLFLAETKLLPTQGEIDMAVDSRIAQLLADFDTATNAIAARIQALVDKIAAGAADNDAIVAALQPEVDKLTALGKSDTPTA